MAISSPGIGSNLDVNGIISKLMAIEQRPLVKLDQKEASYQAKVSAIGTLQGALSKFQSAVRSLSDISKFQAVKVSTGDNEILTASGTSKAAPGNYAIEVAKLAQAQKLASVGQETTTEAIGTGTITIDFGTISGGTFDSATGKYTGAGFASSGSGAKTITIDAASNSLAGIRDAINKAGIGVSAAIVNDGSDSPHRLVLTQTATGKSSSMKISVTGDPALQNLLNHDPAAAPGGQNLSETVTAQNAEFKIDGIAVSKASNTITDVIDGLTLNLAKTNVDKPTSITVARDTSSISTAVKEFVSAYNEINGALKKASSYDAETKTAAVLNGDATVRMLQTQLRNVLTQEVGGGGTFASLSQIGVSVQKDGTLSLDNSKLQKAIDKDFAALAGIFAAAGTSSDNLISVTGSGPTTKPGAYAVEITQLATQGRLNGASAAGLMIDGDNDTLQVEVNGISASIKLAHGSYASAALLAAEVQSKINGASEFSTAGIGVEVSQASGVLSITSNRYGSASSVKITGGTGWDNLMGANPASVVGLDVAGTLNGMPATGSGQILTAAAGSPADGLKLTIAGGAVGQRGTVNFSNGYAYQFDKLIDTLLSSDGVLNSRIQGLNESIKSLGDQRERLNLRLEGTEKRLRAQYTALDTLIASMTSTSSYLAQQLANLPKIE